MTHPRRLHRAFRPIDSVSAACRGACSTGIEPRMRPKPLRSRLILLVVVAIVPLAVMSGVGLAALLRQQQSVTEQSAINLTRALATAVDNELRSTITALQTLALNPDIGALDAAGQQRAHALAKSVLAARPEWLAVVLLTPSGEVVFSTDSPYGEPMGAAVEPASVAEVAARRTPVVGAMRVGRLGTFGVPVRVPVVRGEQLRYVLTGVIRPDAILDVVQRQRIPAQWVVSVFDASHQRVARSREHAAFIGRPPAQTLQRMIDRIGDAGEAFGATETVENISVHTAVVRIPGVRWTVALGVPTAVTSDAVRDSALAYGGGLLLSLALAGAAAWGVSRGIARPMARLRQTADAVGAGGSVDATTSGVTEIDAVADALVAAAALRQRAEGEREKLLHDERAARAAAEQAQRRLQILANASALLSTTLEEESTLRAIGSVIVPDIADLCRLDLLDADGLLQRKLTHHSDPARARAIDEFTRGRTVGPQVQGSFPWAIATGRTFMANFDSAESTDITDPTFRQFARLAGMRATCVVPLIARGRTIGAMAALQSESGRHFTPQDVALVVEVARRAALALDNVRLYGEAQAALAQAQVASRAKDEFLAVLGHELRNPLAPIVTSLDLMARRGPQVDARERQVIERQVKHLSRMVDDLLDVSRITSGKVQLHRQAVDLRDVIARALELTRPALDDRAIVPDVVLPQEPVHVDGDPVRLVQVFCNLLNNAAKFSRINGRVGVELACDGDAVRVAVWDHGVGIGAALLPQVFEPFVQGDGALQRGHGGLGLGLAIARNLVELHGGTIRADSAGPGHGSRFEVTLQRLHRGALPPTPRAAASSAPGGGARILIVDDNEDAAETLSELLRFEGHEVVTAHTGVDALRIVERYRPQVALLDIGLPDISGHELAQRLRADPRTRAIRLIALTGFGREPDRERARAAGFEEHLTKPVGMEALLESLHRQLQAAAAPAT
jgi:signal transduction histidine kinase/ActR/RegA family two-component response regulator